VVVVLEDILEQAVQAAAPPTAISAPVAVVVVVHQTQAPAVMVLVVVALACLDWAAMVLAAPAVQLEISAAAAGPVVKLEAAMMLRVIQYICQGLVMADSLAAEPVAVETEGEVVVGLWLM
jgi:hypothetical protein